MLLEPLLRKNAVPRYQNKRAIVSGATSHQIGRRSRDKLSRRLHGPANPAAQIHRLLSKMSARSDDFDELDHAVNDTSTPNSVELEITAVLRAILEGIHVLGMKVDMANF
ncbi:hypothetical protein EG68_02587 [Paragonimus skrjabini miyazakii]|uniref:Uncharacterized protein n=1 Tax=Paragonimus skrjabini miyazakii TaxID=59628 RepID=A0A8S9Z3N5_9TREM|nr:hypothetical protein EG68_02587 [Paragonimus skrjabini miyazakii]